MNFTGFCIVCVSVILGFPTNNWARQYKTITLNGRDGLFESPNFENGGYPPYPTNITINWIIEHYRGYNSYVMIKSIDLGRCYTYEDGPDCDKYDSVRVYIFETDLTLGHFCNGHYPDPTRKYYATQGRLVVRFDSKDRHMTCRGKGFQAYYEMYKPGAVYPTKAPVTVPYTYVINTPSGDSASSGFRPIVIVFIGIAVVAVIVCPLMIYCFVKFRNKNNGQRNGRNGTSHTPQSRAPPAYQPQPRVHYTTRTGTAEIRTSLSGPPPSYAESCAELRDPNVRTTSRPSSEMPPTYEEATVGNGLTSAQVQRTSSEEHLLGSQSNSQEQSTSQRIDENSQPTDPNTHASTDPASSPAVISGSGSALASGTLVTLDRRAQHGEEEVFV
ncbi:predicted protein [Nematostella vectensis]|uniref:CUB domain-containing protein n=1 Tax=Nematostella vectensis TaxID=45351 RepID=A7SNK6_NEMVE|nr:predicted protein [Nematostella vectensis]|eukprot:XP_001626772.1 predicted protein [Nematostella vectensis]